MIIYITPPRTPFYSCSRFLFLSPLRSHPPPLPRSLLLRFPSSPSTASLHLLTRESAQVSAGHGVPALGEALLTAEPELGVAFLALVGAHAVFARGRGGGQLVVHADVEELGFVGRFSAVALSFWSGVRALWFLGERGGGDICICVRKGYTHSSSTP